MLYSMTGFGRATITTNQGKQISVEIKTLNGKQFDIITKFVPYLRPFEPEIRALLTAKIIRGTTDLSITIKQDGTAKPISINTELAVAYYKSIKEIATITGVEEQNILQTILQLPDVVTTTDMEAISEEDAKSIFSLIEEASNKLIAFRANEGKSLKNDLLYRIGNIEEKLASVLELEPARKEKIRQKMLNALNDLSNDIQIDQNRFEQELIYYIEKIDFSEEKNRLQQHCNYAKELLNNADASKGKVLGFIFQEIGREINTLGSKANDATIQQIVVLMKDELEKAKEQSMNVL